MDGKGWALDNVFGERLWRPVKYEEVYPNASATPRNARQGLAHDLTSYHDKQPHQALGYRTPAEVDASSGELASTRLGATSPRVRLRPSLYSLAPYDRCGE